MARAATIAANKPMEAALELRLPAPLWAVAEEPAAGLVPLAFAPLPEVAVAYEEIRQSGFEVILEVIL